MRKKIVSKWNSSKIRLPPNQAIVFAYDKSRNIVGYANIHHQVAWNFYLFTDNQEDNKYSLSNNITHWHPIYAFSELNAISDISPPVNTMLTVYCQKRESMGYGILHSNGAWMFFYFTGNHENNLMAGVNEITHWKAMPELPTKQL